jgi:heme-degrading monooxygenase HmoA
VPAFPILEAVVLQIRPGTASAFEAAFCQTSPIIASMKGYGGHNLHHFYDRFPVVEHFEGVMSYGDLSPSNDGLI